MKNIKYIMPGILILIVIAYYLILHKTNTNNKGGTVIILNGPSSVGKTSIIKNFQQKQAEPWLAVGIDNFFVGVLPEKFCLEDKPEHHSVMQGIKSKDKNDNDIFTLKIGKKGQKVIHGMHRSIAEYAKAENNVIVDYIKYYDNWLEDLKKSLKGINVVFVKINAPLETIERREKKRKTSPQGHARSHYHSVHKNMPYNLKIDTDKLNPEQSANKIIDYLNKL